MSGLDTGHKQTGCVMGHLMAVLLCSRPWHPSSQDGSRDLPGLRPACCCSSTCTQRPFTHLCLRLCMQARPQKLAQGVCNAAQMQKTSCVAGPSLAGRSSSAHLDRLTAVTPSVCAASKRRKHWPVRTFHTCKVCCTSWQMCGKVLHQILCLAALPERFPASFAYLQRQLRSKHMKQ